MVKKILYFGVALAAVGLTVFLVIRQRQAGLGQVEQRESAVLEKDTVAETKQSPQEPVSEEDSSFLEVPFTPQAPFANWDEIHEDTCEEASVLMAAFYRQGKPLNPEIAESELLKLVDWQKERFGYWKDTNVKDTATMAKEFYGLEARVITNFSADDLKKELSQSKLVLLPAAGRKLGNPFYTQPGPVYHMLVLRGFDEKYFYTNDPGTKRGENYKYFPATIMAAAADWPGSDEAMLAGKTSRAAIVID